MPHAAIVGTTMGGKTFLARHLARGLRNHGVPTLVLHRPREPWKATEASFQTSDQDIFLREFWKRKSHACFLELADAGVDKNDLRFHKCFSEGRHEGHRCFYLTQRAASVHPTIRENCIELYLFNVSWKGASLWAEEFADDFLLKATQLPQFCFIHKPSRFGKAYGGKLTI